MNIAVIPRQSFALNVVGDWMVFRRVKLHLVYDTRQTDVYIGFHSGRLVVTASWFDSRSVLSDEVNASVLIHELAHVLAEDDLARLQLPNFGMVRYVRPFETRQYKLDPATEILTEAKAQAHGKAIRCALGLGLRTDPIKVDPVKALYGLPFTTEQAVQIVQEHQQELDRLTADKDVLLKLDERIRRA